MSISAALKLLVYILREPNGVLLRMPLPFFYAVKTATFNLLNTNA